MLQQLLTNGLPFSKKTLFKLVGRYLNSNCIVLLRYLMGFIVHKNYSEIIARLKTLDFGRYITLTKIQEINEWTKKPDSEWIKKFELQAWTQWSRRSKCCSGFGPLTSFSFVVYKLVLPTLTTVSLCCKMTISLPF